MSIIIGWLIFSAIVSIAASSRGRNGVLWFTIAVVTSPLVAILFVFALPNLKHEEMLSALSRREPERSMKTIGGHSSRVTVDRSPKPFEPDGVLGGPIGLSQTALSTPLCRVRRLSLRASRNSRRRLEISSERDPATLLERHLASGLLGQYFDLVRIQSVASASVAKSPI
jgi:hypothetical protein